MEEEVEEVFQTCKISKIQLDGEATQAIEVLFSFKIPINFIPNFDQISPELNQNQRSFLSSLISSTKIFCFQNNLGNFNEGYKTSIYTRTNILALESQSEVFQLLLIVKERSEQGVFYLGILDPQENLFTQGMIRISLVYDQKKKPNSSLMNCQELLTFTKVNVDGLLIPSIDHGQPIDFFEPPFVHQMILKYEEQELLERSSPARFPLMKKLSQQSQPKQYKIQKPMDYLSPNSDAFSLRQFIATIDERVQVPHPLADLVDNIPHQYSEHLLQGLLKQITKNNRFQGYFHQFVNKVSSSSVASQASLFAVRNILPSDFPLPMFSLSGLDKRDEFFNFENHEIDLVEESMRSESVVFENDETDLQSQVNSNDLKNLNVFQFVRQEVDENTRIFANKIKKQLIKHNLKARSTIEMARKFLKCKEDGTITLDTRSDDLVKMKINVGKNYCDILHPLYMRELEQQTNKEDLQCLQKSLSEKISNIKSIISQNDEELPFENEIHSFLCLISLGEFCELIKKDKTQNYTKIVQIQMDQNTKIQSLIKYISKGGCIYLYIEDFNHTYDCEYVFSIQDKIDTSRIVQLLRSNKTPHEISGEVQIKPMSVESISRMIQSSMINNEDHYLTAFYTQSFNGKKILIMISVLVFETCEEATTFKIRFKVIANTSDYDTTEALIFKYSQDEPE